VVSLSFPARKAYLRCLHLVLMVAYVGGKIICFLRMILFFPSLPGIKYAVFAKQKYHHQSLVL